jgi:hypothetical protein
MKKFLIATLTAIVITTSAFATDANKVSSRALSNFRQDFDNASNVEWVVRPNFSKATFNFDNKKCTAFYDNQGNLIANSYAIEIENLPTSAKRTFAKKYADYTVKEAIQMDTPNDTSYYISAENDKQSVILKVSEGFLSVYKKTSKN